jgi:hypothetical protein
MTSYRLMVSVFLSATLAYAGVSRAVFVVPVSVEAAEACGFTSADFTPAGDLGYAPTQAWWVSFTRMEEYWSAISFGLALAFIAFAAAAARRLGGAVTSGAAVGGGLLAMGALCVSCLAPALAAVGLGLAGGWLAGIPKWLMALNTLLFTAWGTLFLARRLTACPVAPEPAATRFRGAER